MDQPTYPTIIASRPGVMRRALRAMLDLSPHIEVIGVAGGGLSALDLARQRRPALIVIDSGLPEDEMLALLRQVKGEQPHIRCLVLAETTRQQQLMLAAGADAVLMRGEPAERIAEVLEEMGLW